MVVLFGWAHVDVLKKFEVDKDLSSLVHAIILWNKVKRKKKKKCSSWCFCRYSSNFFVFLLVDWRHLLWRRRYTIRILRKIIKMCHNFMTCWSNAFGAVEEIRWQTSCRKGKSNKLYCLRCSGLNSNWINWIAFS